MLKKAGLILSWGLYDLANQFFALNIVSLYFVRWVTIEKECPEIFYSIAFGASMFLVAITAPIMGAVSDILNRRMPFLIYLTLLSIVFTIALGFSSNVIISLVFFAVANFGCQAAIVFYNAALVNIAPQNRIGLISGIGRMLGYGGALIALYIAKPIVLKYGYQSIFLPTGVLFLAFSIPCMIFIKDKEQTTAVKINITSFLKKEKIFEAFRALKGFIIHSKEFPGLIDFIKAAFLGLCPVNVIIVFMSVYATKIFKLNEPQIIELIIVSTVFAILGSIISGYISDRVGAKKSILAIFISWIFSLTLGSLATKPGYFWLVGSLVGFTLGSTWVVLRAMAIQLVPKEKVGEVFGLFNLAGYLSSIVGVIFWGLLGLALFHLGDIGYRISLFCLNIFLFAGLIFVLRIPDGVDKN